MYSVFLSILVKIPLALLIEIRPGGYIILSFRGVKKEKE
jgi:hypothetical protein